MVRVLELMTLPCRQCAQPFAVRLENRVACRRMRLWCPDCLEQRVQQIVAVRQEEPYDLALED